MSTHRPGRPAGPDRLALFAFYHLGLDRQWRYRFRNLNDAAREFNLAADQVMEALRQARMDPETVRHVDFNLSKAHVDAQELDLQGAPAEARRALAERTWAGYQAALKATYDPRRDFASVDYEDLLGLESKRRP